MTNVPSQRLEKSRVIAWMLELVPSLIGSNVLPTDGATEVFRQERFQSRPTPLVRSEIPHIGMKRKTLKFHATAWKMGE